MGKGGMDRADEMEGGGRVNLCMGFSSSFPSSNNFSIFQNIKKGREGHQKYRCEVRRMRERALCRLEKKVLARDEMIIHKKEHPMYSEHCTR